MARLLNQLNDRTIRSATGPGRLADGGGLFLLTDQGGSRRWLFRFRSAGREREAGFGSYPAVSLADARRRRDEARTLIAAGGDPIVAKRKAEIDARPVVTFGAFADELIPVLSDGFRNAKHSAQWTSTLKAYASSLRSKPIADITTDDVLACLTPIWATKAETASRVRGRIERVLDAAKARGLRTGDNPARWRGHLDQLLPKRKKLTRGHHRALPYPDMPVFVAALRERPGIAARALEFLILTAARTSEVTELPWSEIDTAQKVWTVPAARMKREREHRVPLTDRAMAILEEMQAIRRGDFVFPSFRADKPLSNGAFDALLDRMKVAATAHGMRSAFRDWAGDLTSHQRETVESALAHVVGDETERSYRRGDALAKRWTLMEDWAEFVTGPVP